MEETSPSTLSDLLGDQGSNGHRGTIPERRLMAAILRRAVYDFVLYRDEDHEHHALALDSARWIFCRNEEDEVDGSWTFTYICKDLGLNPAMVRRKARQVTVRDITRLSYLVKS